MNLFINSPAYFTQEQGVIDEIYKFCTFISRNIDISLYTDCIDTIGITPIIAPISSGFTETRLISLTYRMASISLFSDYKSFCEADITKKKEIILDNILKSLYLIERKLKREFNYEQLEKDIKTLVCTQENG